MSEKAETYVSRTQLLLAATRAHREAEKNTLSVNASMSLGSGKDLENRLGAVAFYDALAKKLESDPEKKQVTNVSVKIRCRYEDPVGLREPDEQLIVRFQGYLNRSLSFWALDEVLQRDYPDMPKGKDFFDSHNSAYRVVYE